MPVKRVTDETIFEGPVRFFLLPIKTVTEFIDGDTEPDVSNCEHFVDSGVATTVTDFTNGAIGQTIKILGRGALTVSHNANIKTNTGANKLLDADKVYRFTYFDDEIWYEDA